MDETIRRCFLSALIAVVPATMSVASAAEGLTEDQMDRVTGGRIATAVDTSEFFAARARADGVTVEALADADDDSARATGSAQTLAPDSANVSSRAETVGVPPPPREEPMRVPMRDLRQRMTGTTGGQSLPFSWLR